MYKVISSFWSKTTSPSKDRGSIEDEDGWVLVSDAAMVIQSKKDENIMTSSWIATPPLIKNDDSSAGVHHFNPIENLLIEHASMSVYEQIASKARKKRPKDAVNDNKLAEEEEEAADDNDDRTSVDYQHSNSTSMDNQNSNSSATTLDISLMTHHRRLHHRRKRPNRPLSKSALTSSTDDPKSFANKAIERSRLSHSRTPKVLLPQPSRCLH